jgi:hypothetical protein
MCLIAATGHSSLVFNDSVIIIISLLMSPLLGHRPSTRAQCGLVGANNYKCTRDQLKHVGAQDNKFLVTHPMTNVA